MKPADSASAAIRGATLAFQRDKLEQKQQQQGQQQEPSTTTRQPLGRNHSHVVAGKRDNGAYTAATEAVRSTGTAAANGSNNHTIGTRAHLVPGRTISTASAPEPSAVGLGASRPQQLEGQQQQQRHTGGGGGASAAFASQAAHLGLAPAAARMDGRNQSLIAATLAASRSASPTRPAATNTGTNTAKMAGRRAESVRTMSSASSAGGSEVVDSGPLASAGSLISMFERGNGKGPSPPESVVSGAGAEDKIKLRPAVTVVTASDQPQQKKVKKPKKTPAVVKRDTRAPPPTPPPATRTRRDPMAETAPGGDGKSMTAAAEVSGPGQRIDQRESLGLQTAQKQQRESNDNSNRQSEQPTTTKLKENKAATPPQRPMTPAAATTHTSTSTSTSAPAPAPLPQHKPNPTSSHPRSETTTSPPRAIHPSTPPPLKPLMSRTVAEVVSPQPTRVTKTPLSPMASPHLTLNPSIHVALASPSPDPPKKRQDVLVVKRPPTPPKPRGNGHKRTGSDEPKLRGRSYSHHLDAAAANQSRASIASAMRTGQSVSPQHSGSSRPSSMFLSRRHSMVSAPSLGTATPGHTPLDNLTDAIMAGSLASSRLTPHHTGSKLAPPPVPKRQKSPRLLHTLRNPHQVSDDEEDSHKKGHRALLRKGKHAHHEGSRKKWREEIRPRERKRYEALWASNRGIMLTDTRLMSPATSISSNLDRDVSQCVANVVVREVWKRSRLPLDELAEIYDLVDRSRMGMLSRAEFVVGTWLVDQRLKGRKVPARVTDSVWGSANGVTVKGPNGK
ncbi:hypothetical protein TGAM01_v210335 [Trichoderma gamsii]|uniref:EH domain-containing protein n=1 Tax=Trichoderma gamsii TaxID=398673 RepID=A0A2P4Z975_9HYPO|nr:hypothetical protein TGAM01_v210335 [Trichoderma gamsii]PON20827.1 hypothetical protein TGAM01_v210335 [Trichoderma gamsii]